VDKENVVYIHNGILLNHKEQMYVICRKIDGIMLSKMNQIEKDKYRRWWLEGGSRKHASYSEILERY
jgi:hypothetical protein